MRVALRLHAGAEHDEALGLVVLPVRPALAEARVADDADDLVALDQLPGERRLVRRVQVLGVLDVLDRAAVDAAVVVHALEVVVRDLGHRREVDARDQHVDPADLDRRARRLLAGAHAADALRRRRRAGPDRPRRLPTGSPRARPRARRRPNPPPEHCRFASWISSRSSLIDRSSLAQNVRGQTATLRRRSRRGARDQDLVKCVLLASDASARGRATECDARRGVERERAHHPVRAATVHRRSVKAREPEGRDPDDMTEPDRISRAPRPSPPGSPRSRPAY